MTDPFIHLPDLRDRLKAAGDSELRVTAKVLAQWDERAKRLGRPANWRLTDEALMTTRRELLGDFDPAKDLWFFAYGSLMWDPGIYFAEVRLARLEGFQRRFTYKTVVGRGSPEFPALLLGLERQVGSCTGLAFRVAADWADNESAILWRREMVRGNYSPTVLPMTTPQGEIEALVFAADPRNVEYAGELPLEETAAIIATGSGPLGSNFDYLEQLSMQLEHLGIEDLYVKRLMDRTQVAFKNYSAA